MPKTYDVVIVDTKTRMIESVIGRNMSEKAAEKRVMTGVSRINVGPYCVLDIPYKADRKSGDILTDKDR